MTNNFWPFLDAFEEWHHLFERAQYEIIIYLDHKKLLVFDDNSCFESMSNSMGIVIISILICHHLSSLAPTSKEFF
jgi:hypothetical protein